jgi:ADP-ribose pyrophosphatase
MQLFEQTVSENIVYKGKKFNFCSDEVLLENGQPAKRDYINHPGGVAIVALNEKNEIALVRQFRYPYREVVIEIPAGTLEKGEEPFDCAVRELKEETGLSAQKTEFLGNFYPSPGYSNEMMYLYLSTGLSAGSQKLDDDEFIVPMFVPLEKALEMVLNGEIKDGKTMYAIFRVAR